MTASPIAAVLTGSVVIFDWNGTLMADTERARIATNSVIRHREPLTTTQFIDSFHLPLDAFLTGLGIVDTSTALREWNHVLASHRAPLRPGADSALRELRTLGAVVGVVSAAADAAIRADIAQEGLGDVLDFVRTDVSDKESLLRDIAADFAAGFYVGDTEYDVLCARAAGLAAIALDGGYRPASALRACRPALVLSDLDDLPDQIARLYRSVDRA